MKNINMKNKNILFEHYAVITPEDYPKYIDDFIGFFSAYFFMPTSMFGCFIFSC
jgi:hypothetical protein